jgi:arylsulfatase A-like enzyme
VKLSHVFRIAIAATAFILSLVNAAFAGPNVIVIVADDLSWHDAYYATDLMRPNIDSLSTNGVRFTNGYVTAPVCSPSRAGLITGRYQQRFGHETNPGTQLEHNRRFGLPATETTMGERFKALNYATGWIGKSHLGNQPPFDDGLPPLTGLGPYHPNVRGFDHFYGFLESHHYYVEANNPAKVSAQMPYERIQRNGAYIPEMPGAPALEYLTTSFQHEAEAFIEANKTGRFFLYLPFNAVHFTLEGTADLHNRTASLGHADGSQRRLMAETLLGLDDAIGAILSKLRSIKIAEGTPLEHTLEDETLIFFTSDNGGDEVFGADNGVLGGRKTELYEGGIRVPFVVQWKSHIAPAERTACVSTLDILPTALAAAGVSAPSSWQLDGLNLLPYMQNAATPPARTDLFWRVETDGVGDPGVGVQDGLRAMRRGSWKLIKPGTGKSWELYDLDSIEGETKNLADENPTIVAQMLAAYEAWNSQLATPLWAGNDLEYPRPEFVLEDVRVGSTTSSYVAPDFLSSTAQFAYQDGASLFRQPFSLRTGFPILSPVLVDSGLAPLSASKTGPQWGLSSAGAPLFYTKPGTSSHNQVWVALNGSNSAVTFNPIADCFGARVSQDTSDDFIRMAFNSGATASWATVAPGSNALPIPDHPGDVENGRWIPGTGDLVYVNSSGEIARLITATNASVPISDDSGAKSDAWAFYAPEFNGELCYAAVVDRTAVAIYRDLHDSPSGYFTRIATLTLPATSPPRFLYSLRPIDGLRGFNGVSWFTCSANANYDPLNPGTSEIWLLGAGPDASNRVARRLDDGTGAYRTSPRTVVGEREVFCYYTRYDGVNPAQLRLARTGLVRPVFEGMSGFASMSFATEPTAGRNDPSGIPMLGTETTHLVRHEGKLYAAQGSAGNPAIPLTANWSGAQVLVKDTATADWRVDEPFHDHLRIEAMDSFTFTRAGLAPLANGPREVLVMGMSDFSFVGSNISSVRTRMADGSWVDSHPNNTGPAFVSAFGFHADDGVTPTGDNLFAGLSNGEIHRGSFIDGPGAGFTWSATPELDGVGAVTGFAEANGVLYAACALRQAGAILTGGLYRRVDGTNTWVPVYRWPGPSPLASSPIAQRAMTGLTTVPDPRGTENEVLLGARSWPGVIERIDPINGHSVTVELDVRDFFARRWNDATILSQGVSIGYTKFTPASDPVTGETVHLIGVWIEHPAAASSPYNGTHFLIRHHDATYEAADIPNFDPLPPGQTLRGTRAIAVSPFSENAGLAFYFGGYDSADDDAQNTAWIKSGVWAAFPQLRVSQQDSLSFQLTWPATSLDWILESTATLAPTAWQPVNAKPVRSPQSTTLSVERAGASGFFRLRRQ